MKRDLSYERLKQALTYDETTGEFRWRISRQRYKAGSVAGNVAQHGYHRICIDGQSMWSHRLAWLYVYGEHAKGPIDHIDGNRSNNAIANLRVATARQNQTNKPAKNNSSGLRGVTRAWGKWRAAIRINGRSAHLGVFDTPEEASAAYMAAAAKYHGEFAYAPRALA